MKLILKRRFGHYRKIGEWRLLVSLNDVNCSGTIVTIRSLLREDIDLSDNLK